MKLAKIEALLQKYLEAKTTLEEESVLKKYFKQNNIPAHLYEYKKMFNYFSESALETTSKSITLPVNSKIRNLKWLAAAALVIFFISVFSLYQKDIKEKKEAQLAFLETQNALNLISLSLNKGESAIAQLKTFENTQNRIFKSKK